jgi:hypothetical protein
MSTNIGATDSEYEENVENRSFATTLKAPSHDDATAKPTKPTTPIATATGMRSRNTITSTMMPTTAIVVGLTGSLPYPA